MRHCAVEQQLQWQGIDVVRAGGDHTDADALDHEGRDYTVGNRICIPRQNAAVTAFCGDRRGFAVDLEGSSGRKSVGGGFDLFEQCTRVPENGAVFTVRETDPSVTRATFG